jgi:glycosyltransferase involved in cell wall biosynthesis
VLATDRGGPPELVRALGPGWTVAAGDTDAWGVALHRLRDDDLVDETGRRARRLWEQRYTPEATLTALVDIYGSVARKREVAITTGGRRG